MRLLETKNLTIKIANKTIIKNLNWQINTNEKWAILGENGVGKTTLLNTLANLYNNYSGDVFYKDKRKNNYSLKEIAKFIGVLSQHNYSEFSLSVFDFAISGRYPYLDTYQLWENEDDINITNNALNQVGLLNYKNKNSHELSGGEYQKLKIATILTQSPNIYLLDEPNTHLDIKHQIELLTLLNKNDNTIMAIHDINLAYRFCTHILIMLNNSQYILGNKETVFNAKNLSKAFNYPIINKNGYFHYE